LPPIGRNSRGNRWSVLLRKALQDKAYSNTQKKAIIGDRAGAEISIPTPLRHAKCFWSVERLTGLVHG
jgi:hypothetical protein